MSEMIEHICKALIDDDPTMFGFHRSHIESKKSAARATLKAMREPTDEMIRAGDEIIYYGWPGYDCAAKFIWQAMIDAAFAECSGVQVNSPQGHTVHETASNAQPDEEDEIEKPLPPV